jgi:methylphosphotriester-DNA--protein-cysteine methyltransferase
MRRHKNHSPTEVRYFIRNGKIAFAGNLPARIYGTLGCSSGKRMKKENRVFFETEAEAVFLNFRPCGHCVPSRYLLWKKNSK